MRVLLTFFAIAFLNLVSFSQTFNGGGGNVPATSITPTCFNINVTGVGVINTTAQGLASICFNITHGDVGDLEITLTAPDGTMVPLSIQNGGTGNNYTNTCFTATATNSIKVGTAPYTGSFLPEGWLGAVNNGQNANGTWRLCIRDRRGASSGSLVNWSLTFNNTPAPMPPPIPTCANTLPSNSSCSNATLVCDFNGQCGTTSGSSIQDWPGSGLDGSCFGLNNNSFIKFVASAATATFSVWIPSTSQTLQQGGVQMLFFSGTCNSGPVTVHGCYPRILPYPAGGPPLVSVVTATGLTPGNTYYLMIDGANGDNTNFTIAANTGVNVLNITPAAPSICEGASVNLTATGGNGVYAWSPATYLNATSGTTVTSTPPLGTQTYTVTSTTATGCPLTKDVTVTVTPRPAAPTGSVTAQPTCTTGGNITITAPLGAGLQYSVNGGPYQTSPVFSNLPGGVTYNITVRNAAGCFSPVVPFPMNAAPVPPAAPTGTVTQPTCTTAGSITITSPLGAGFLYSLNGGTYQPLPSFTNLPGGVSYNITVQNAAGCTSAAGAFPMNAAPVPPAAPTGTVTQPTCTTAGSITITSPLGAGFLYSLNGGTYQPLPSFTNLPGGVSYNITVQNAAGCTSPAGAFPMNAAPVPPAAPTGTVTQPACGSNTFGTITITSPVGAGIQYSMNGGAYQSNPVFANLTPGLTYNFTVQSGPGCISPSVPFAVNAAAPGPVAPTGTITQPACGNGNVLGTITITSPVGAGYQYSLGAGNYQNSPVFPNLQPGTYFVLVKDASDCVSALSMPFILNTPTPPPITTTLTQPDCSTTNGGITINSPLNPTYIYAIRNLATGTQIGPQASPVFTNVPPGQYLVLGQPDLLTICISATTVIINAAPTAPPVAPTGTVTVQTDCNTATGTITITAPIGAGLQYSNNSGTTYQTSPIFPNLGPGTYNIIVQNAALCTSAPSQPFTINAQQAQPAKPVITVVQPACPVLTGTITVASPTGSNIEYSRDGTTYQASNIFLNVPAGDYNITARFIGTTCVSAITNASITRLTAADCTTGTDIYFPSAFTPDGDGLNETFGPGPRSSLTLVSNYTLLVYNRYGEMVYKSTNPLQQWNGSYKGKVSGNFTYTWVATYRFNGRPLQTKKGTVTIVR